GGAGGGHTDRAGTGLWLLGGTAGRAISRATDQLSEFGLERGHAGRGVARELRFRQAGQGFRETKGRVGGREADGGGWGIWDGECVGAQSSSSAGRVGEFEQRAEGELCAPIPNGSEAPFGRDSILGHEWPGAGHSAQPDSA